MITKYLELYFGISFVFLFLWISPLVWVTINDKQSILAERLGSYDFLILGLGSILWPFLVLLLFKILIIDTIKFNIELNQSMQKWHYNRKKHPDHEIVNFRELSGQQIDSFLTKVYEEKRKING